MDNLGLLISVVLYLAILTFAVGWFLVPRWIYGSKALMIEKARLDRNDMRSDEQASAEKRRTRTDWRQARAYPDSPSH